MYTSFRFVNLSNFIYRAATIEITGIRSTNSNSEQNQSCETLVNTKTNTDNDLNEANKLNSSMNNEDNELDGNETINHYYYYIEKLVDLRRPDNYSSRGFGFLLNSGQSNKQSNQIFVRNLDDMTETSIVNQNYAQIVVVEPG